MSVAAVVAGCVRRAGVGSFRGRVGSVPPMPAQLTMSKSARDAFLATLHVGMLAVADDAEGPPIASPVWYSYEPGGDLRISIGSDSVKARLLRSAGRASFCASERTCRTRSSPSKGRSRSSRATSDSASCGRGRYLGDGDLADGYLSSTAEDQTVVARLTPERWRTRDYSQMSVD